MSSLYIHGIGHFHPPNIIDNKFLENLDIGTSAAWIDERLGIRERRTVLDLDYIRTTKNSDVRAAIDASLYTNTDTSERAARMALRRAGIHASEIGFVLSGSSGPIHSSPPEACMLADRLGIVPVAFDVNSACNTFLTHCSVAQAWLGQHECDYGLLVQAENFTRSLDYSERTNCSLMGDATTAVVVSTKHASCFSLEQIRIAALPSLWQAAVITAGKHFIQRTAAVKEFALAYLQRGIPSDHDSFVVFHQANLRILETSISKLGIPPERHLYNVDRFGNCAAAGSVSVLSENWDRLSQESASVAISTVGAGLTYGSAILLSVPND
ncbi:3-oxoacyl-ACP synthase III family protein [Granulicella sp. S190]|uniref:3-oxoacyl-ACP synthase III family protein n=1 Tax=Granulicella sp. S190 TaxID=1747226 RepID=UPI00131B46F2|nr:3-oxoacyl-[acyl-carrier-protein] synthase III C-terminal domain-containing protein [Granulicella sp. S190]